MRRPILLPLTIICFIETRVVYLQHGTSKGALDYPPQNKARRFKLYQTGFYVKAQRLPLTKKFLH